MFGWTKRACWVLDFYARTKEISHFTSSHSVRFFTAGFYVFTPLCFEQKASQKRCVDLLSFTVVIKTGRKCETFPCATIPTAAHANGNVLRLSDF